MVEIKTRVVVYGSSLQLAGIAVSLKADQSLEVVCVDPHDPMARQSLSELSPAAIAFDLTDPPSSLDAALMYKQPSLLLIGVDPSSNELLILSGRPQQAMSVSDLVAVIGQKQNHPDKELITQKFKAREK